MPLKPPFGSLVIIFVEFYARHFESEIVAGYAYRTAAQMRIENLVARFGIVRQQPFIERYGLLCGMYSTLIHHFISLLYAPFGDRFSLTHSVPHECKQANRINQTAVGYFAIRKRALPIDFIPYDAAGAEGITEIIASPNDLVFRYTLQFHEIVFVGNRPMFCLACRSFYSYRRFSSSIITQFLRTIEIGRIDNRQIERSVWKLSQEIHTISVVQCNIS